LAVFNLFHELYGKEFRMRLKQKPIMKKRFLVALAILTASISFAQQKKAPPPPPAPPPPKVNNEKFRFPPPIVYPDGLPDDYKAFLKRNPTVKSLGWSENKVHIHLKSGKEEVYNLNNEAEVRKLENKYGGLPMSPPPPPPPPKAPKSKSGS
jgi:hypothetical protein